MKRLEYTDQKGRALCLKYRNGGACRRLATAIVAGNPRARCKQCAEGGQIIQENAKGFRVSTPVFGSMGWTAREYHPIR